MAVSRALLSVKKKSGKRTESGGSSDSLPVTPKHMAAGGVGGPDHTDVRAHGAHELHVYRAPRGVAGVSQLPR